MNFIYLFIYLSIQLMSIKTLKNPIRANYQKLFIIISAYAILT